MRDILFRGKRVDNGEWVYGSYYDFHIIKNLSFDFDGIGGMYRVIPESVGQFTGLTDKNGNKIFEGDILKDVSKYGTVRAKVVFEYHSFRFLGIIEPNLYWNFSHNMEVYDNIYK